MEGYGFSVDTMNSLGNPSPYERGYPLPQPEPEPDEAFPPGEGGRPVAHYLTFGQVVNAATRAYRWTHDEALRHSRTNALAARRDPVVMDALRSRQIPTAQLQWHIEVPDDQDQRQTDAAAQITEMIRETPRLQTLLMHCLEALWYGRYGVQLSWVWDYTTGQKRMLIRDHWPVNGDKLVFKYSGEVGVLVHATFEGDTEQTERGRAHFLTPREREQVIIHRHEPEDADFLEPELAGGIHGVGIRHRIYWFWYLRSQVSAFLMDYLERVGAGGFTVYYYEHGNPRSRDEVKAAAEEQHRHNVVLFPRYRDGSTGGPGIQRIEASQAGSQVLQSLVTGYFDEVIRRYILGQNLTSEATGTGLGSGVADLHADTFARLIKYDAANLAETLTTDVVAIIQRYLFPGLPRLRLVFDVDKPNARDVLEAASAFYQMGGDIDADELRSIIGLAKPQPGNPVLAKMGNLTPAAMTPGMPQGMPMMGPPGADPFGQGMDGMSSMGGGGPPMMMSRRAKRLYKAFRREMAKNKPVGAK